MRRNAALRVQEPPPERQEPVSVDLRAAAEEHFSEVSEGFEQGKALYETARAVGVELRRLRERKGFTQGQLAEMAMVDQAVVSRIECGRWGSRGINLALVARIAAAVDAVVQMDVVEKPDASLRAVALEASV